jgi:hypothetical protein
VTLAEFAAELGLDRRTLSRDVQSAAAKLRPLFIAANEAERRWILAAIEAHLRGEDFFSTVSASVSGRQCPIPRRFDDDVDRAERVGSRESSPPSRQRARHIPRRWSKPSDDH